MVNCCKSIDKEIPKKIDTPTTFQFFGARATTSSELIALRNCLPKISKIIFCFLQLPRHSSQWSRWYHPHGSRGQGWWLWPSGVEESNRWIYRITCAIGSITYPIWEKGKSSTQKCLATGYVSSLEGTFLRKTCHEIRWRNVAQYADENGKFHLRCCEVRVSPVRYLTS